MQPALRLLLRTDEYQRSVRDFGEQGTYTHEVATAMIIGQRQPPGRRTGRAFDFYAVRRKI